MYYTMILKQIQEMNVSD